MSEPVVRRLSVTPLKGTRLHSVREVDLRFEGAAGDRRFFVIDDRDRMVNAKQLGELLSVVAECSDGVLRLRFPPGDVVEAPVTLGESLSSRFYSRTQTGRLLVGPWSDALSAHVRRRVRLVEASAGAVDRGAAGAATLISSASLERLAAEAAEDSLDPRRFRMLIEVDGIPAHGEDEWVGRVTRIGEAVVRWGGHVGRCLITSRDPDTGEIDVPTLDVLRGYRGDLDTTEPLPFGIHGEVLSEGVIRVGDPVSLLDR